MERKNSNDENVPKTEKVEYPDSKSEEEMEVGGGASLSSPNASSREEELLRSPGGEAEVAQECAAMDPGPRTSDQGLGLRASRVAPGGPKERKKEGEREGGKGRRNGTPKGSKGRRHRCKTCQRLPPAANDSPVASASASGQLGTSARSAPVQGGGPRVLTKLRGPLARKAAREAGRGKRTRAFVLPTAPAAVRGRRTLTRASRLLFRRQQQEAQGGQKNYP